MSSRPNARQPQTAIVGGDASLRARMASVLEAAGYGVVMQPVIDDAAPPPDVVLVVDAEPAALIRALRLVPGWAEVPVVACVSVAQVTAASEAIRAGAVELGYWEEAPEVIVQRVRNTLRLHPEPFGLAAGVLAPALVRINELLTQRGDEYRALVAMLLVVAETLRFERASLVAHLEGSEHAFVVAANDAPVRTRFTVNIQNYPELALAIRTGEPVLIDDVRTDPRLASVREKIERTAVRSLAVFPVQWRGKILGAIMLRRSVPGVAYLEGKGVELGGLIASITAAHLRHGAIMESLREFPNAMSRSRYEAERRLRGIDSLREHFEAGSDGVIVLDEQGYMLFVNAAAERIAGFLADNLLGSRLADLLMTAHREAIEAAVTQVLAGTNVDPFDVGLPRPDGAVVWASVSTSTVLAESGAVILMLRDVSAQRVLEHELVATKEFLERLIDSTVDAIVAADMQGQIVLFNQGAERLFGYTADCVIGRLSIAELYEAGVAKQIMRMLRSTSFGGVGRLEQTRREIRCHDGELVPVSLTASIVYEDGREIASVGIFTDLRDRIRMEQRLLDAQQKLQISEKQMLAAELAGAAAHELNQPLTSIMGYAQLVRRQSDTSAQHLRAVDVILQEAERMAELVRKIGKITKYETQAYVGNTRIFDLDRSIADSGVDLPRVDATTFEVSTDVDDSGLVLEAVESHPTIAMPRPTIAGASPEAKEPT